MPVSLYHKDVYAPRVIFNSPGMLRVRYARHAEDAAKADRYGDLSRYLRSYIDLDDAEIVEVEVQNGEVTKRVVRCQVTEDLVLVLVIGLEGLVRTVWGNLVADKHRSLDRSKFVQPPRLKDMATSPTVH